MLYSSPENRKIKQRNPRVLCELAENDDEVVTLESTRASNCSITHVLAGN